MHEVVGVLGYAMTSYGEMGRRKKMLYCAKRAVERMMTGVKVKDSESSIKVMSVSGLHGRCCSSGDNMELEPGDEKNRRG